MGILLSMLAQLEQLKTGLGGKVLLHLYIYIYICGAPKILHGYEVDQTEMVKGIFSANDTVNTARESNKENINRAEFHCMTFLRSWHTTLN